MQSVFWQCFFYIFLLILWFWHNWSSSNCLLLIPPMQCLLFLEIFQDLCLKTLHPHSPHPRYPQSLSWFSWLALSWSLWNHAQHLNSFFQQAFAIAGLMTFRTFCNNDGIFNEVVLLDFHSLLSGFTSIVLTSLFIEYCMGWALKVLMTSWSRDWIRDVHLYLGANRLLQGLHYWTCRVLSGQRHCPTSKEL